MIPLSAPFPGMSITLEILKVFLASEEWLLEHLLWQVQELVHFMNRPLHLDVSVWLFSLGEKAWEHLLF